MEPSLMSPKNPDQSRPENAPGTPRTPNQQQSKQSQQSQPPADVSRHGKNPQRPGDEGHDRLKGPRYDDRPPRREEPDVEEELDAPTSGSPRKEGSGSWKGLPHYGDREPGDPRRVDIEAEHSEGDEDET